MKFNRAYTKAEILKKAAEITQTPETSLEFMISLGVLKQNLLWQLVAAKEMQIFTKTRMKENEKHDLCSKLFGINVHTLRQLSTTRPNYFKKELKSNV